jgi:hypothetical protein
MSLIDNNSEQCIGRMNMCILTERDHKSWPGMPAALTLVESDIAG